MIPQLFYFDIRARAEPIRLILEEMGVSYDDHQVTDDWAQIRSQTPFDSLPLYRKGDLEIGQSHAIYRHLARIHDLYGTTEEERIRCDVVEEAFADLNNLIGRAPWRPNFSSTRDQFIEVELQPVVNRLGKFLLSNPSGPSFWVGSSLTFVDLVAFAHLDCTGSMFPEALAGQTALSNFCDEISARPRISEYIQSDRRPSGIQYGPDGRILARSQAGWVVDN